MRSLFDGRHTNFETKPKRFNIQRSLSLCVLLWLSAVSSVYGLDSDRRISQYGHTAWRVQDGAITPAAAITQTIDGYVWLGTSAGLMRFDGVRFVLWSAPQGSSLPDRRFTSLLGARDGSLWIGMTNGLSRWKDGQLQTYMYPGDGGISAIFEDSGGVIWVTRYHVPEGQGPLCRVEEKDLRCYGKDDGIPVKYGLGLTEDSLGNLWFGSSVLCRWRPGSSSIFFDDVLKRQRPGDGVVDVVAGPAGSLWAAIDGIGPDLGVRYYSGEKWTSYVVPGFNGAAIRANALFVDRSKSLWIGTVNKGLYRVHDGVADHYGSADGLSGDNPSSFYEDHEGNLWVVTEGGVDMFRNTPVVTFSIHEGLSSAGIRSVLALRNGSVWIGNKGAVDILRAGRNSPLLAGRELPGQDVAAMFEDHTGAVWLGLDERLMIYEHKHFSKIQRSDGSTLDGNGEVVAITEDAGHDIWALTWRGQSLLRIRNHRVQEEIVLGKDLLPAAFLAADQKAGIWICSRTGRLALYRDGHLQMIPLEERESPVVTLGLIIDSDNSPLLPTAHGLFRWNDGRWSALDTRNGLPCNSIFSAVSDNSGALWLYAACGLLRVEALELAKWRERADNQLQVRAFDVLDGAHPGHQSTLQPGSSKAPDGRLWFLNGLMVQTIAPDRLYGNAVPPPVHIEQVVADHKTYERQGQLRLPALTRELEIDYTGLSFALPQKVRFRYKLEGHDAGWEEPGTRRQAFYSDLPPRTYRFRVVACNNDGIWNEVGAALEFSVAPAWYQTTLFRLLCAATAVFVMWVLYRLRVRKIARAISARFDERLAERTRLARELHDTFLQTIQGSKLVADDALEQSADPVRMRRAMERLSVWLGQATEEGRAALNSLRTSTTERNDLAEALQRATEDDLIPSAMAVTLSVVGQVREMHPIVRDEVYRIGFEAIRNAAMHSKASRLEVDVKYAHDLMIRVSDNGIGIEPAVADHGKDAHFGLQGMRERAARIGGELTLVSSAASGTEIILMVPGGIVFRKAKSGL